MPACLECLPGDAKSLLHSDEVELAGAGELSRLHRMSDLSGAISGIPFTSCVALNTLSQAWLRRGLNKDLQPAHEWIGKLSNEHYTCMSFILTHSIDTDYMRQMLRQTPLWLSLSTTE